MLNSPGVPHNAVLGLALLLLTVGASASAQVTITNVTPRSGPVAGGTRLTITGTNLSDGVSTYVEIGGLAAVVESQGTSSLTVLTPGPTTAGARDVVVTSAFGVATRTGGFTYTLSASLKAQNVTSVGNEASGGTYEPSFSADGRHLAFRAGWERVSGATLSGIDQIYVRDRTKEATYAAGNLVAVTTALNGGAPNGPSGRPRISASGRYVAFWSDADNLVPNDTLGFRDVFVRDRDTDVDGIFDEAGFTATYRVSVASNGVPANGPSAIDGGLDLSPDGQWVVFTSAATNLVAGDNNGLPDVFLHSLQSRQTTRVSVATSGVEGNGASRAPGISRDGLFVVFASDADNLVGNDTSGFRDVFVRDRLSSTTLRLTQLPSGQDANGASDNPSIDDDGLAVALQTNASNLLPELASSTASQVIMFSLRLGTLSGAPVAAGRVQDGVVNIADAIRRLLSGTSGGAPGQQPGNNASTEPEICASGECVTYPTTASNLNVDADPDQNGLRDVMLQRVGATPSPAERISKDSDGNESIDDSTRAAVDATGGVTALESRAELDNPGDYALGNGNVFVRGTSIIVSTIAPSFAGPRASRMRRPATRSPLSAVASRPGSR
jgi:Tol biopolymer transport system component